MDTKHRILDEALTLFSEKGYANVFVADIAERVGIRNAGLRLHNPPCPRGQCCWIGYRPLSVPRCRFSGIPILPEYSPGAFSLDQVVDCSDTGASAIRLKTG
ncbi:MAG: TetR/AcrR family transcriptional regulator [Oscillospiraceae bacterium]|nr:TetR/AcrR family transcriptional regulator [Oscillospiraceae bacterium]